MTFDVSRALAEVRVGADHAALRGEKESAYALTLAAATIASLLEALKTATPPEATPVTTDSQPQTS